MIKLKINDIAVEVPEGTTILKAAEQVGVKVPRLCFHEDVSPWAACGICVVKMVGSPKMVRACATPCSEGMEIITHDTELYNVRRTVLQLILSRHPNDCLRCARNGNCELQQLSEEFGIREFDFPKRLNELPIDDSTPSIEVNPVKCVSCGRCVAVCQQMQGVWALEFLGRGDDMRIAPAADVKLNESPCIKCGQCSAHCPVGAIYEKSDSKLVHAALADDEKYCVVQIAPAVRVAIGEAFGYESGELLTGKLYAALRRLGFKAVFDTNFSADLTIMEEGSEFIKRVNEGGALPLITSCCPAWTDYMEKFADDFVDNFSTAKSPQQMMGAVAKTYYAESIGVKPENIYMVSIMPCTAKKYEITRTEDMYSTGYKDVDVVLTTRELSRMIKSAGVDFRNLPEEEADSVLGTYAGAGTLFGVTGGVMEAALRTAVTLMTGKKLPKVEFEDVRGLEGVKEATLDVAGKEVRIAVAHTMSNIEQVLDKVRAAREKGEETPYHFIEVMACRGGCIGGGGQPHGATDEIRAKRIAGLYKDDEQSKVRCSHENPEIQKIYKDFLGEPLSEKAHKYLHTHYKARPVYQLDK
jgi:NADH-quinone oxidoreductase subunit G